jgi:acetyl-CoA acetyltransferase family protein
MARVVTTLLGWETVPGTTITRYCASSLQTTRMAMHAIRAGEGHAFISAGVEMVSRYGNGTSDGPETARNPRFADAVARTKATAQGGGESYVAPEGLPDIYIPMGLTAENVARVTGTTREQMDDFAFASQQRYAAAAADGFWSRDVMPITLADGTVLDRDESPRLADRDKMATLQPVFRPDGLITAGNACPLNDGAAAVVVVSDVLAEELGLTPLARVVSTGVSGLNPELMGLGPVEASRRALASAGLTIDDMDIVEINEAFAAQVLPSAAQLGDRPGAAQPVRRGDRGRAPVRDDRGAHHLDADQRARGARRPLRPRDDVRRRWPGHGDGPRAPHLNPARPLRRLAAATRPGRGRDAGHSRRIALTFTSSDTPDGVANTRVSPSLAPSTAFPIGDSAERTS